MSLVLILSECSETELLEHAADSTLDDSTLDDSSRLASRWGLHGHDIHARFCFADGKDLIFCATLENYARSPRSVHCAAELATAHLQLGEARRRLHRDQP
jgi:hypothetical protein